MRDLELLLHPRVPPLIQSMPHIESLSLFREEESQEETETRRNLQLGTMEDIHRPTANTPLSSAQSQHHQPTIEAQVFAEPPTRYAPAQLVLGSSHATTQAQPESPPPTAAGSQKELPKVTLSSSSTPSTLRPPEPAMLESPNKVHPGPASGQHQPTHSLATPVVPQTINNLPSPLLEDEDEPMPSIDMDSDSD